MLVPHPVSTTPKFGQLSYNYKLGARGLFTFDVHAQRAVTTAAMRPNRHRRDRPDRQGLSCETDHKHPSPLFFPFIKSI